MRVISLNVNGIRACTKHGLLDFLDKSHADVVCVQETRAVTEQLPKAITALKDWHFEMFAADPKLKKGYSGVGIFSREKPDEVESDILGRTYDREGRFIVATFGDIKVASVYFPNGSGNDRDNSRVPYKLRFTRKVEKVMRGYAETCHVLVAGDFNTAHEEIDLARPRTNLKSSGFLPEERKELSRWLKRNWIDTFRSLHPDEPDHYTWWRQWGQARENNVGWRIDYIMMQAKTASLLESAFIWPDVRGSDHCPIGVDLNL